MDEIEPLQHVSVLRVLSVMGLQCDHDLGCSYTMMAENRNMLLSLEDIPDFQAIMTDFEARAPID